MIYNQKLKYLRESKGYMQKEVANILKTTQQQYSLYETGQRELKTTQIIKLCLFYNVSADYLLGLSNNPTLQ